MDLDLLINAGFGILILLLFVMLYFRDIESRRKLRRMEQVIEGLVEQNQQFRRDIINLATRDDGKEDVLDEELHRKVQKEIHSHVMPILESLKDIEEVLSEFQEEQQGRLDSLEERTKTFNRVAPPSSNTNEKQVLQLYSEGKHVHEIAKDLRLGLGEVEFILKMNHLQ